MYFTIDRFWDILSAISSNSETASEGNALTDVLDSLALDAKAKASLYFDVVMGGYPPSTQDDWIRLRTFLLDWYAAHQTISSSTSKLTDPRTLSNPDLDELFRSFGYPYSTQLRGPDDNPVDLKINFFLDLVNLYKIKGTPQSILEVLQYYGVTKLDIYEFFIKRQSPSALIFEGNAITGTSVNPSKIIFDYDRLTATDPHWLYTEQQILDLYKINKINLPSKTPYLGVRPIASIDGAEIGILIRIVQDQYKHYLDTGNLSTANAEIGETGEVVSLLELYLSIIYVFQKLYNVGQVGDNFICYDGTHNVTTEIDEIIDEFDAITVKPTTRAAILTGLASFYDTFTRETPRDFLQLRSDAETILSTINPSLKNDLDSVTLTNSELLFSLVKDLSSWVRINLGYGFVNLGFIMFGLDSFFEDLKPVINFFKPYRARLLLLELLQINNPLFNTIVIEDNPETVKVEFPIHDWITGNGNPCCTEENIDTTDCCTICLDDSTSNLYYQRETYDCGSYHDIGAVTDILQNDFFPFIEETRHIPIVCVPPDGGMEFLSDDGTSVSPIVQYSDSTSGVPASIVDGSFTSNILHQGGNAIFDGDPGEPTGIYYDVDGTTVLGYLFEETNSGHFDCITAFDEVWIEIQEVGSSSSSSSSTSTTPLDACSNECSDTFDSTGQVDTTIWAGNTDPYEPYNIVNGVATMRVRDPLPTWQAYGDMNTKWEFNDGADFDVSIQYDIRNINDDDGWQTGGWFNLFPYDLRCYLGVLAGWQQNTADPGWSGSYLTMQYWADGPELPDWTFVTVPDSTGGTVVRLRVARVSGEVRGYYWNFDSERWEWNDSTAGILLEIDNSYTGMYIETGIQSPGGRDLTPVLYMDNFCVSVGCDDITWWW